MSSAARARPRSTAWPPMLRTTHGQAGVDEATPATAQSRADGSDSPHAASGARVSVSRPSAAPNGSTTTSGSAAFRGTTARLDASDSRACRAPGRMTTEASLASWGLLGGRFPQTAGPARNLVGADRAVHEGAGTVGSLEGDADLRHGRIVWPEPVRPGHGEGEGPQPLSRLAGGTGELAGEAGAVTIADQGGQTVGMGCCGAGRYRSDGCQRGEGLAGHGGKARS